MSCSSEKKNEEKKKKSGWGLSAPCAIAGIVLLLFFIGWGAPPMGVEDKLLPRDED